MNTRTFRLGYAIPNPVNALDESETRYPFAYLKPASDETEPEVPETPGESETPEETEL